MCVCVCLELTYSLGTKGAAQVARKMEAKVAAREDDLAGQEADIQQAKAASEMTAQVRHFSPSLLLSVRLELTRRLLLQQQQLLLLLLQLQLQGKLHAVVAKEEAKRDVLRCEQTKLNAEARRLDALEVRRTISSSSLSLFPSVCPQLRVPGDHRHG